MSAGWQPAESPPARGDAESRKCTSAIGTGRWPLRVEDGKYMTSTAMLNALAALDLDPSILDASTTIAPALVLEHLPEEAPMDYNDLDNPHLAALVRAGDVGAAAVAVRRLAKTARPLRPHNAVLLRGALDEVLVDEPEPAAEARAAKKAAKKAKKAAKKYKREVAARARAWSYRRGCYRCMLLGLTSQGLPDGTGRGEAIGPITLEFAREVYGAVKATKKAA